MRKCSITKEEMRQKLLMELSDFVCEGGGVKKLDL